MHHYLDTTRCTELLACFKQAEDRVKISSTSSSTKTWALFLSGAKLTTGRPWEAWDPGAPIASSATWAPTKLREGIKTWNLTKYSGLDVQWTGGGSYCLQKNRVGIAPRQEKYHFISQAATITFDRICTFLKKIAAEVKSRCVNKCNTKAM